MASPLEPIKLYRLGPIPEKTFSHMSSNMSKKWLSGNKAFWATGSPLLAKAWKSYSTDNWDLTKRDIYEITMKPSSKLQFFTRASHYVKSYDPEVIKEIGYPSRMSGGFSHIVKNRSELKWIPYDAGYYPKGYVGSKGMATLDPEYAQIIAFKKDVLSAKPISDVFKELPSEIKGTKAITFSEHLRKYSKPSGNIRTRNIVGAVKNNISNIPAIMNTKKVNHSIESIAKKVSHLFKIKG